MVKTLDTQDVEDLASDSCFKSHNLKHLKEALPCILRLMPSQCLFPDIFCYNASFWQGLRTVLKFEPVSWTEDRKFCWCLDRCYVSELRSINIPACSPAETGTSTANEQLSRAEGLQCKIFLYEVDSTGQVPLFPYFFHLEQIFRIGYSQPNKKMGVNFYLPEETVWEIRDS